MKSVKGLSKNKKQNSQTTVWGLSEEKGMEEGRRGKGE